jgi:hypothetical protein
MRRRTSVALGGALLAVALTGVALATIPSANGTISACYTRLGTFRVIDTDAGQRCVAGERSLQWNQTGATGAAGPQGPVGATGPAGPPGGGTGTSVIVGRIGPWWPILDDETRVLRAFYLPSAGKYLIEATVRAHTDLLGARAYLYCDLYAGSEQLDWMFFNFSEEEDYDRESVQLTGWLDATGGESVEVRCRADYDDPSGVGVNIGIDDHGAVVATKVDSLTESP